MINRAACIIGTAGHVDHGKSSLIKALTGIETDRLAEELRRGLSIELGFAHIDLDCAGARDGDKNPREVSKPPQSNGGGNPKLRAAIIDVPGHERFIRNMLAGITGVDMVLFVVAADDGVMAQSREHFDIVRLLGVTNAIFVITKSDLVDAERIAEVEGEVRGLIGSTPLESSTVVAVSTLTGDGIPKLKSLIGERLIERPKTARAFGRLPVDRSFAVKGFGTVVTGTVAGGSICVGDTLISYPGGVPVKVRGLESLHAKVDSVGAGERVAVNITGLGYRDIGRGAMLVSEALGGYAASLTGARARLRVDCFLELTGGGGRKRRPNAVKNNATLKLHHMTGETLVRFRRGGKEARFGRLFLEKPLLMLRGDRFILRDPATNTTVGGGTVYLPYPGPSAPPRLAPPAGDGSALYDTVERLTGSGVAIDSSMLGVMLNLDPEAFRGAIDGNGALKGGYRMEGGLLLKLKGVELLKSDIASALRAFHAEECLSSGMESGVLLKLFAPRVYAGLGERLGRILFKMLIDEMLSEGDIRREGSLLSAASHRAASKGSDAQIEAAVLALFSGITPVGMKAVEALPYNGVDVRRVMGYLQEKGRVVKLKERSFISSEAIEAARRRLTAHMASSDTIKASEFRDLLGCGRKLAIEILEYFDRSRVTLRKGDLRTLR